MIFSPKLVKRYRELKAQEPDCLLLMQVGAFMDVMNQDARAVSEVTGAPSFAAGRAQGNCSIKSGAVYKIALH